KGANLVVVHEAQLEVAIACVGERNGLGRTRLRIEVAGTAVERETSALLLGIGLKEAHDELGVGAHELLRLDVEDRQAQVGLAALLAHLGIEERVEVFHLEGSAALEHAQPQRAHRSSRTSRAASRTPGLWSSLASVRSALSTRSSS